MMLFIENKEFKQSLKWRHISVWNLGYRQLNCLQQFFQANKKRKHKNLGLLIFVREMQRSPVVSSLKRPVMRKAFQRYDVVMSAEATALHQDPFPATAGSHHSDVAIGVMASQTVCSTVCLG